MPQRQESPESYFKREYQSQGHKVSFKMVSLVEYTSQKWSFYL